MTDEELMLAICAGDQRAYQIVVKEHMLAISHYAYRLLGNSKDTQDITQEVFLKLWMNAQAWHGEKSKLSTWLHRITHNLCIDYLRKHARVQTRESFDDEINKTIDAQQMPHQSEKQKKLNDLITQLPENQRSALTLCHYQNFSNKEAAAIMDISVKALESLIARAKKTLKAAVETDPESDPKQHYDL